MLPAACVHSMQATIAAGVLGLWIAGLTGPSDSKQQNRYIVQSFKTKLRFRQCALIQHCVLFILVLDCQLQPVSHHKQACAMSTCQPDGPARVKLAAKKGLACMVDTAPPAWRDSYPSPTSTLSDCGIFGEAKGLTATQMLHVIPWHMDHVHLWPSQHVWEVIRGFASSAEGRCRVRSSSRAATSTT